MSHPMLFIEMLSSFGNLSGSAGFPDMLCTVYFACFTVSHRRIFETPFYRTHLACFSVLFPVCCTVPVIVVIVFIPEFLAVKNTTLGHLVSYVSKSSGFTAASGNEMGSSR